MDKIKQTILIGWVIFLKFCKITNIKKLLNLKSCSEEELKQNK